MSERERNELRRSMQPTAQDQQWSPPDIDVYKTAFFVILIAPLIFVVASIVIIRNIGRGPGTYDFGHQFVVLDADGSIVDESLFVFTMNPDDFNASWRTDDLDSEGRVVGAALSSLRHAELRDDATEVCLSESFVFMWADNFEIAAEIPAGTCLDDLGDTRVVLR